MRYLKSSKKFDLDQSILAWCHLRGIMLIILFFMDFYSFDFNKAVGMNNFFIYISERYFLRGGILSISLRQTLRMPTGAVILRP
ncbi:Uncharacterised protein [Yersinia frederiksenii]|nr:Uncharacterised protein [Yersinia frederiksenii]